jgi:hypothetical protein
VEEEGCFSRKGIYSQQEPLLAFVRDMAAVT